MDKVLNHEVLLYPLFMVEGSVTIVEYVNQLKLFIETENLSKSYFNSACIAAAISSVHSIFLVIFPFLSISK